MFHSEERDYSILPNVWLGILILIIQVRQNYTSNCSWDFLQSYEVRSQDSSSMLLREVRSPQAAGENVGPFSSDS